MRLLVKAFLWIISALAAVLLTVLIWFFFYPGGLPDVASLAQYAPDKIGPASDSCSHTESVAVPYDSIGANLRNALSAVEVSENDPGVLTQTFQVLGNPDVPHRTMLSLQISRSMCFARSTILVRNLAELRTAEQLERHFSRHDLFTIYANRVYFGENLIGVENASLFLFRKKPADLTVAEAALLAGIPKAPSYYSSVYHPDRALKRRNEVIDAMVGEHMISSSEAESAKASGLGVAVH